MERTNNYNDLKPFRFWCQKVLPLVYDDSLSYYELLDKVIDYLNKTMEDVTVLNDDTEALYAAYNQLQSYVNNYFDNLDVQQEIDNKLDAMVLNGTLTRLVRPFVGEAVEDWLEDNVEPTGSVVLLDTTMTVRGAAADAEAVGYRLSEKEDILAFDDAPTAGSMAPVHSYGIKNYVDDAVDDIEDEITDLKEDINKIAIFSPNLIDPTKWKDNTRCVYNDSIENGSSYEGRYYYYIGDFEPGTVLVSNTPINGTSISFAYGNATTCKGTAQQSSANDFYEVSENGHSIYTYTVPSNNTHIGVTVNNTKKTGLYIATKAEYDLTHKVYEYGIGIVVLIDGSIEKTKLTSSFQKYLENNITEKSPELTWRDGYYWNGKPAVNSAFSLSNPILIHSGETIVYYGRFSTDGGMFAATVDREGIHIQELIHGPSGYATCIYTATQDDEYIVFSRNTSSIDYSCVIYTPKNNDVRIAENQIAKNDFYKVMFNKVTCVGDSLTIGYFPGGTVRQNNSYPFYLAKMTDWTVVNKGHSGASATMWYNLYNNYDFSDSDAVFICLGTNEGLPDTVGESLGDHTDYYCRIIDKIQTDNPNCKIFLYSVLGSSVVDTAITNQTIQEIAELYSCAFCDWRENPYYYMRGKAGQLANQEYHPSSTDSTHFGKIGYLTMARCFLALAMSYIDTHKTDYELPYASS